MESYSEGIAPVAIIVIVAAVLALAGGGWWWNNKRVNESVVNQQNFITVDFCGTEYKAQALILERTDVVKIISSLANAGKGIICSNIKSNIKNTDTIGAVAKKEADNVYLIALYRLYDMGQAKDPFNQSVLIFKFDFKSNRAYLQQQFDGSFEEIGVIDAGVETLNGSTTLTANWKTYRNEQYGFEFKYPPDWEDPVQKNRAISIGETTPENIEGEKLRITIIDKGSRTLDQLVLERGLDFIVFSNIQKTIVDGADARKFIEQRRGGFCAYDIYAIHNDYIYQFWYGNSQGCNPASQIVKQAQEVLSTFKFTK